MIYKFEKSNRTVFITLQIYLLQAHPYLKWTYYHSYNNVYLHYYSVSHNHSASRWNSATTLEMHILSRLP